MKPKTKRQSSAAQSPVRWTRVARATRPPRSATRRAEREKISPKNSRIEHQNPGSPDATSPSPPHSGGEGRGEEVPINPPIHQSINPPPRSTLGLEKFFLRYQSDFIRDPASLVIVEKGRQIGLSYAAAYKAVRLVAPKTAKLDVWVASRDEVQARQFLLQCKRWARTLNYAARANRQKLLRAGGKSVQLQVLKFANGLCIYCLSSSPDAIVGKSGHVILDEFALHKDQRQLYAVAKPVTQWGGTLSIISTHRGVGTVFNELVTDARRHGNKMGWSLHTIPIQKAVEQGLVEKIDAATSGQWTERFESAQRRSAGLRPGSSPNPHDRFVGSVQSVQPDQKPANEAAETLRTYWLQQQRAECIDEEQWLQEYCCTPADESAAFITYEMITACEDDSAKKGFSYLSSLPSSASLYIGFDVARTRDLSVIDVEEKIGDVFWERLRIELKDKTFAEQEYELRRLLDLPAVRRCCIDATGLGMQLAENMIARYGHRVEAVRFSGPVKEELAFPLRAAHEDRTLRYARDEKLRADLRGIKKETTAGGNLRFAGESADSHCDRFWAKALALHAGKTSRAPGPIVIFENTKQSRVLTELLYGEILG